MFHWQNQGVERRRDTHTPHRAHARVRCVCSSLSETVKSGQKRPEKMGL